MFKPGGAGSHSHSRDSAIDSDLAEWDTEHLELDMTEFRQQQQHGGNGLGIDLSGGRDDNLDPFLARPVYISSIAKGSFLDGRLKVNDCLLRVNGMDCRDMGHRLTLQTLVSTDILTLVVRSGHYCNSVLSAFF